MSLTSPTMSILAHLVLRCSPEWKMSHQLHQRFIAVFVLSRLELCPSPLHEKIIPSASSTSQHHIQETLPYTNQPNQRQSIDHAFRYHSLPLLPLPSTDCRLLRSRSSQPHQAGRSGAPLPTGHAALTSAKRTEPVPPASLTSTAYPKKHHPRSRRLPYLKFTALINKLDNVTYERFDRYWTECDTPLAKDCKAFRDNVVKFMNVRSSERSSSPLAYSPKPPMILLLSPLPLS